jgi:hypothetical protein
MGLLIPRLGLVGNHLQRGEVLGIQGFNFSQDRACRDLLLSGPVAEFIDPDWGDNVYSGIGGPVRFRQPHADEFG